ncbi:hypothetical protein R3P38DRAFT_2844320 [Favolaschia claudopus]|uniref:Uncharacterized protein n=1 Tax=Favolaschia claudopus TaxID=2862362 RepID=A0AAW0E2W3_9AGAR
MSTASTTATTFLTPPTTTTYQLYRISLLAMTLALGYLAKAFRRSKYAAKQAQDDLLVLRKAIESKDSEMASLHRSVETMKEDTRDRVGVMEREVEDLQGRLRDAEGELAGVQERRRELEAALMQRDGEMGELMEDKTRLVTEHQGVLGILSDRTADLKDAQARLRGGDDRLTDQAVLVLVQALNTKIKETAALLADAFEFEEKKEEDRRSSVDSEEMVEVHERATEILGHEMVEILRTTDHHGDPALVRLAFQSGMIEYARWMSASWFFEDPEDEQLLADIYQRVRMSQDQIAAGRWRAVTHTHVQELINGEPELSDYFIDAFVNVLLTAGFRSSSAALHAIVGERFGATISALVRLALGLNKAIGTEVTACELKALSATPGVQYEPATMIDVVDGAVQHGETVLCTCELGLSRADKIDGVWTRNILLKPKVVLPSGLEELLAQGESTPTKTKPQ